MITILNVRDIATDILIKPDSRYQLLILSPYNEDIKYYGKSGYDLLLIGEKTYNGFGGRDVTAGFLESKEEIINKIKGNKVIIVGQLGDSMCNGLYMIADELLKLNKEVFIIAATTFAFDGPIRKKRADETLNEIRKLNCKYELFDSESINYKDDSLTLLDSFREKEIIITEMVKKIVKETEGQKY